MPFGTRQAATASGSSRARYTSPGEARSQRVARVLYTVATLAPSPRVLRTTTALRSPLPDERPTGPRGEKGENAGVNATVCEVVITADDEGWLLDFTRALVRDRLVACGQHITPIRSIYRWQGQVEESIETRVALHTRSDLVPAVLERARDEHPYEVPCVLVLPVEQGSPDYLAWVVSSTGAPG